MPDLQLAQTVKRNRAGKSAPASTPRSASHSPKAGSACNRLWAPELCQYARKPASVPAGNALPPKASVGTARYGSSRKHGSSALPEAEAVGGYGQMAAAGIGKAWLRHRSSGRRSPRRCACFDPLDSPAAGGSQSPENLKKFNVSFWEWEKIPRLEAKTSVGLRYYG